MSARKPFGAPRRGLDEKEWIEPPVYAFADAVQDGPLFELAEELIAARHWFYAAATDLSIAERRLQRMTFPRGQDLPTWFCDRERDEEAARIALESLYQRIAHTRACSKAGVAIKLSLLAAFYRGDATLLGDNSAVDDADVLVQSIVDDLSVRLKE
jgi:hypothetical protein